jgi:hypothetical protein
VAEETTDDLTQTLYGIMPFAHTLGITVLRYEPAEVRARLVETDVRDERDRLIVRTSQTQLVLSGGLTGPVCSTEYLPRTRAGKLDRQALASLSVP